MSRVRERILEVLSWWDNDAIATVQDVESLLDALVPALEQDLPLDPMDYDRLPPDDLDACMECGGRGFVVVFYDGGDEGDYDQCPNCVDGTVGWPQ